MKLLHIDTSILGANSASRQVSAEVVERPQGRRRPLSVTYRDLAAEPLSHLSGAHLAAAQGAAPESPELQSRTLPRARRRWTSFSPPTSS